MALEKTYEVHLTPSQMIILCRLVGGITIENIRNKDDAPALLNIHERLKAKIKEASGE